MKNIFESRAAFHSILFSYLTLFLYGLLDNVRGPIYPSLIEKYSLTNVYGSWFFSATSLVFMLSAGIAPKVLYYRGYLASVRECLIMILFSQVIFYFAPNFLAILLGCILLGYGVGILSVIQNVLVLTASPKNRLNQLVNGLHANYAAASLLAPLIVAFLFRKSLNFETIFAFGALISSVLLIGSFFVSSLKEPEKATTPKLSSLLKWKYLPIGVMLSSYVAGEVLVGSRLAQFLIDTHSFTAEKASFWTSLFFAFLLAGRLIFTLFQFKIAITKLISSLFIAAIVISLVGILVSPMFLLLLGFLVSPLYAMIMIMAKTKFPEDIEKITALVIVLSGIFIIFMHTAVGWLTDQFSIQVALYLAPCFFVLCLGILKRYFYES